MSKKNVFKSQIVDHLTGEVTSTKTVSKTTSNTAKFLLAYVEAISNLAGCNGSEVKVVLACLKYVDFNSNELLLNPHRREEIVKTTKLKKSTVDIAISKLFQKNIFIKEQKTNYLNPELFFYGADLEKDKWFELHLRYKIKDDSDLDRTGHSGMFDFAKVNLPPAEVHDLPRKSKKAA